MFKRGSAEIPQDTVRAEADMLCGNSCLDLTWLFFFFLQLMESRDTVYKYKGPTYVEYIMRTQKILLYF